MIYTEEQELAIDIARLGEDACIVAGPGSGKTTVLVERYRRLVESGVEPSEILAITFTEKAASNMRSRLAAAFAGDAEKRRKLERAQVSTIHGFCTRLLKDHALTAGVDPEFSVLDEQESGLERSLAVGEALDATLRERRGEMLALIEATDGADFEALIPKVYEGMRCAGVRPRDLGLIEAPAAPDIRTIVGRVAAYAAGFPKPGSEPQRRARDFALAWLERARGDGDLIELLSVKFALGARSSGMDEIKIAREEMEQLRGALLDEKFAHEYALLIDVVARFDVLFGERKRARAGLDFNDLEWHAVRLLEEHPEVRTAVHEQFRQIITDEFQDTSGLQARLLKVLCKPGTLYAVGDLNQSIFGFRHATPKVFLGHRDRVVVESAHYQELVQNWRSREPILQMTQTVLREAAGIEVRELVAARELPSKGEASVEVLVVPMGEEGGRELEAAWVAERILALRETLRIGAEARAVELRDFAVIVRNTSVMVDFIGAFEHAGIPYNLNKRQGFFETREAKDLLHLLRMVCNPLDEASTLGVLRSPLCGLSDEGLLRLRTAGASLWDGLQKLSAAGLDEPDEEKARRFSAAFLGWREAAEYGAADRLVWRALDEMGVAVNPGTARGANVEKFAGIARVAGAGRSLRELVVYMEAIREADQRETDSPVDDAVDAVQMMSAHAAKGLEFPVVILPALDKGTGGDGEVLNFTPEHGLGMQWSEPGGRHRANAAIEKQRDVDEGNRLLYVALTRAEEHLLLSWSGRAANWAKSVSAALDLKGLAAGGEAEVREYRSPDGKSFGVRVFCPDGPPEWQSREAVKRPEPVVRMVDAPRISEQFDPNRTATELSLFAGCRRKFYLAAKLGWRRDLLRKTARASAVRGERDAATVGTEVHALLAGEVVEKPSWEATRLAAAFDRSPLGKKARSGVRVEREWDFVMALGELIVQGSIDLWFEEGAGLVLVDYKTDDVGAMEAVGRGQGYGVQLGVYALALERATSKKVVRAVVYFLRPDVAVPVALEANEARLERLAGEMVEAEESGSFPLQVAEHCRRCEFYRSICPARLVGGSNPIDQRIE